MLLFTAKTRNLIDQAIMAFSDRRHREVWAVWAKTHTMLRRPGGPADDGEPPPPREVILAALAALEQMEAAKRRKLSEARLSEDEASDLESDISYIEAVADMLHQMPAR